MVSETGKTGEIRGDKISIPSRFSRKSRKSRIKNEIRFTIFTIGGHNVSRVFPGSLQGTGGDVRA
jgi:hypothetical protein